MAPAEGSVVPALYATLPAAEGDYPDPQGGRNM